jgi:uncharacterized phage protein (TIGR01671 family)
MREIKFRAFDRYQGKMFYSEPNQLRSFFFVMEDHDMMSDPMQFTGMKDRNGNNIYEGDIIKSSYRGSGYEIGTMVFDDLCGKFQFRDKHGTTWSLTTNDTYIEVLGNVYQNPEILKETP